MTRTEIQNLLIETIELETRIKKLDAFINSEVFKQLNDVEQNDLCEQYYHMNYYLNTLNRRLKRINL